MYNYVKQGVRKGWRRGGGGGGGGERGISHKFSLATCIKATIYMGEKNNVDFQKHL